MKTGTFRKSTFSDNGSCVEVAALASDTIAVRNSNHPDAGTLVITSTEWAAFLSGVKRDEFG